MGRLSLALLSTAAAAAAAVQYVPHGAACISPDVVGLPYCNPSVPIAQRVADLLSRLTVAEKINITGSAGGDLCSAIDGGVPRLSIPATTELIEVNSGVSAACYVDNSTAPPSTSCPTIFPAPLLLGASFNRTLWRAKGAVVGTEARAFNNLNWQRIYGSYVDLLGFGPDINLVLDPRNGRNGELASEDPTLSGLYAAEYTRGMQEGEDSSHLLLSAALKHYTAYQSETNRFDGNVNVSTFDLLDSYLPGFELGFTLGASSGSMCSYTSINGVPSCADKWLLTDMVRSYWGRPDATTVSDCTAIEAEVKPKGYAANYSDATAKSILAGTDACIGSSFIGEGGLASALSSNAISESDLDAALTRTLTIRFKLGMFDSPNATVYTTYGPERIGSPEHRQAAYESTQQGLVLLRNFNGSLPLPLWSPSLGTVAVVGPHASSTRELLGDMYEDAFCPGPTTPNNRSSSCVPTIGSSVAQVLAEPRPDVNVLVAPGVGVVSNDTSGIAAALDAVSAADAVILAVGYDFTHIEHEGEDHPNATLPGIQQQFVAQVYAAAAKKGTPVVLVLINAGQIAVGSLLPSASQPAAVIESFYPGFGAPALVRSIFGLENRWGRLPYTLYADDFTSRVNLSDARVGSMPGDGFVGRTYRYYTGTPSFAFGTGLSYSSFTTACNAGPAVVSASDNFTVAVTCTAANVAAPNSAGAVGDEILLAYHSAGADVRREVGSGHPVPFSTLRDFQRVGPLTAGQAGQSASFAFGPLQLALVNAQGQSVLYPGTHTLTVSPRDSSHTFAFNVTVTGSAPVVLRAPPLPSYAA